MPAHLTILPPRQLIGTEEAALEFLEEACSRVVPFDVEMGDVETFLPTTPTVFIQVKRAAYRMRELHDQLCAEGLNCRSMALHSAHDDSEDRTGSAGRATPPSLPGERWAQFSGSRTIHVDELMFVRETDGVWQDVAPVPLGRSLLSSRP